MDMKMILLLIYGLRKITIHIRKKFIDTCKLQKFAMKTPWNPNLFCSEDETNRTVNTSLNEQVKSLSAQVCKKKAMYK